MNKEKEIKEMTEVVMCAMEYREKTDTPNFELIAQNLINAGYGNVKQAVKEFAEKVKQQLEEIFNLAVGKGWGYAYEYINDLLREYTND